MQSDFVIPVVWPLHPITIPNTGISVPGLGHAGVIIVNGSTGSPRSTDQSKRRNVGRVRHALHSGRIPPASEKNVETSHPLPAGYGVIGA
jgi:hypothetical protein